MRKSICTLLLFVAGYYVNAQSILKDSLTVLRTKKSILELKMKIVQQQHNLSEEVGRYNDLKKQYVNLNSDAVAATEKTKITSSDMVTGDVNSSKAATRATDKAHRANKNLKKNLNRQASSQKRIDRYNNRIKKYSNRLKNLEQKAGVPLTPVPPAVDPSQQ